MLDFSHIPTPYGAATVETFLGNNAAAGEQWMTWQKPRGKSMAHIMLIGKGGNGGNGAVGANSTAAGGGGGGSGAQISMLVPLWAIPDRLYLSLAGGGTTTTTASYVAMAMKLTAGAGASAGNDTLLTANGGGNGGNASGATAGAVGAAAGTPTVASMALGWQWVDLSLGGQAGIIGGTNVAGAALTIPVTGLLVTGGTGGGGLPAAAASGTAGGSFTVAGHFPPQVGGLVQATATLPANNGSNGGQPIPNLFYFYGGTGGGSTHGTATGGGLVASRGGNGGPGCGGGGGGGALTGSTAGGGGLGGPAICVITCW